MAFCSAFEGLMRPFWALAGVVCALPGLVDKKKLEPDGRFTGRSADILLRLFFEFLHSCFPIIFY